MVDCEEKFNRCLVKWQMGYYMSVTATMMNPATWDGMKEEGVFNYNEKNNPVTWGNMPVYLNNDVPVGEYYFSDDGKHFWTYGGEIIKNPC